ncbi:MAG TPA: ComEA family DNA-binding protein [Candidatus Sulfotelmatobacter sp.]|nr:ComEA family DNA-binding protein [Candidatus Sulfotelmatobacter sp.]
MRTFVFVALALVAAVVLFRPAARAPAQPAWSSVTIAPEPVESGAPRRHPRARRAARLPADAGALAYVAGSVVRPGVYPVPPGARVRDLLAAAGGTRADADLVAVNLAAHVEDGDEVVVPKLGEVVPRRTRRTHGPRRAHAHAHPRRGRRAERRGREVPASPVDLNRADAEQLAAVPGIGPALAERIVAFRAANGPFGSTDELLDVEGVTDKRLDAAMPYLALR